MATHDSAAKIADGDQLDDGYFNDISGVITVEAGETVTAGQVGYVHLTNGEAYVSDTGTADDIRADGIFLTSGSDGDDVVMQTRGVYTTTGLSDKEDYYLGASGALSTTLGAVRIGTALSTTQLYLKIDDKRIGYVQEIRAWHKSITGGITQLSAYWIEMDGTTISDAESPLNGETIDDLNTGGLRFLRGKDTSGGTGGTSSHLHTIAGSTEKTGETNQDWQKETDTVAHIPPYFEVVWIIKIK